MEPSINDGLTHEDELKDPLFDHPEDKVGEAKDEDGYDSDNESVAGKVNLILFHHTLHLIVIFPFGFHCDQIQSRLNEG